MVEMSEPMISDENNNPEERFWDSSSRFIGAIDELVVRRFDAFAGWGFGYMGGLYNKITVKTKGSVLCQRG